MINPDNLFTYLKYRKDGFQCLEVLLVANVFAIIIAALVGIVVLVKCGIYFGKRIAKASKDRKNCNINEKVPVT